jgi:ubiquinone biosynthesis accessory factor UbiK
MLNNEFLNDLSNRISQLIPMASGVRKEVEGSIHEALQSAFSQLNLITREEFDAQLKVLERAENTIAALEEKITALEKNQKKMGHSDLENEKQ